MAKLNGILPLTGTIDNITFVKTADGLMAKRRNIVNPNRKMGAVARNNSLEFIAAGKGGKVLREALKVVLKNADGRMIGRLQRELRKCLQADMVNEHGQRNLTDGDLTLMQGFDLNKLVTLTTVFPGEYVTTVDRQAATAAVVIADFHPSLLSLPEGATHYRFICGAAAVDFSTGESIRGVAEGPYTAVGTAGANGPTLTIPLAGLDGEPVFVVLGLEFFLSVNGGYGKLDSKSYNALRIVKVDV